MMNTVNQTDSKPNTAPATPADTSFDECYLLGAASAILWALSEGTESESAIHWRDMAREWVNAYNRHIARQPARLPWSGHVYECDAADSATPNA